MYIIVFHLFLWDRLSEAKMWFCLLTLVESQPEPPLADPFSPHPPHPTQEASLRPSQGRYSGGWGVGEKWPESRAEPSLGLKLLFFSADSGSRLQKGRSGSEAVILQAAQSACLLCLILGKSCSFFK
uniref:Uncharacterized protein n=1 Tax=Naja naja TaxID=35670 RepID=A0A8C6YBF5_NAJNA